MSKDRKSWTVIPVTDFLRAVGIIFLLMFFYVYSVGSAVGLAYTYKYFFGAAAFIAFFILLREPGRLRTYYTYYIWQAVFLILVLLSIFYTNNEAHSVSLFGNMLMNVFKVSVVSIICGDFKGIIKLMRGFSYLGLAIFVTLLMTNRLYEGWRLGTNLLGNANTFALIICVMMTPTIFFAVQEKRRVRKVFFFLILAIDLYMIFLSGGRKFVLYGIVFLFISVSLNSDRISMKRLVIAFIAVACVVYVGYKVILNTPSLYQSIGIRLVGLGTDSGALGTDNQASLMERAWKAFTERPIFGWGIGGFQQYNYEHFGRYTYAHSNYLELLADYGIVGLIAYYYIYIKAFVMLWRNRNSDRQEIKLYFPLLVSVMVMEIFAITFNQTAFIPLFIMWIVGFSCERSGHSVKIFDEEVY